MPLTTHSHTSPSLFSDAAEVCVEQRDVVPGDIVKLFAGELFPGDVRLLQAKDLFVG